MSFTIAAAKALADGLVGGMQSRWDHLQAVGRRAEELSERVVLAALSA
ncbi:hypothetical protein [Mobilicoccus sp.]|nr:hypothetical protein [Mobilicoccus sp.]